MTQGPALVVITGLHGSQTGSVHPLIPETGPVTERLRVHEIDHDEGQRLVRIILRGSGLAVTWRRAQMVLLSAPIRGPP